MELLEFARGPAMQVAIYVFIAGSLWRVLGVLLLQRKADYSAPRNGGGLTAAVKGIWQRSFTAPAFKKQTRYSKTLGYAMHIGLFMVIFLFVPHIVFFKDILGFGWIGLPNNVIYFIGVFTVLSAIALLMKRMTHPVLKLISNFDDYFSWLITVMPLITGLLMPVRLGIRYEVLLAIHILSVAALLIWLPFGKLAHTYLVFITRGTTGQIFEKRGARI
jgi:nitrate reductase gamma subunit